MFYPAMLIDEFDDARTALFSMGIEGEALDSLLREIDAKNSNQAIQISTDFDDEGLVLVIAPSESGVNLCYGFTQFASQSSQAARDTLLFALVRTAGAKAKGQASKLLTFEVADAVH